METQTCHLLKASSSKLGSSWMLDVKWEPFIHVHPAWVQVFGCFAILMSSIVNPAAGVSRQCGRTCWKNEHGLCALTQLRSPSSGLFKLNHPLFDEGAERETFAIGHLLKRLFLDTYNCRQINVKVSLFSTLKYALQRPFKKNAMH